jgi:elongator complex protein 1
MSLTDIRTSENIVDCSISLTGNRIAILTATGFEVYDWDCRSKPFAAPKRLASWSSASRDEVWSITRLIQIVIQHEDCVRLLSYSKAGDSKIIHYAIEDSVEDLVDAHVDVYEHAIQQGDFPRNILTDINHRYLWWQTATFLNCLQQPDLSSRSAYHPTTEIVVVRGQEESSEEASGHGLKYDHPAIQAPRVFSLSRRGELFANEKLLSKGCTSFVATNAHLVFTTSLHLLKFVHMQKSDGRY